MNKVLTLNIDKCCNFNRYEKHLPENNNKENSYYYLYFESQDSTQLYYQMVHYY
jgi:hypothetical protein